MELYETEKSFLEVLNLISDVSFDADFGRLMISLYNTYLLYSIIVVELLVDYRMCAYTIIISDYYFFLGDQYFLFNSLLSVIISDLYLNP